VEQDCTARVLDADDLSEIKVFKTERPVNAAAISSLKPHVLVGGGQDAAAVTTTSGKVRVFSFLLVAQSRRVLLNKYRWVAAGWQV
jgi:hypothetical protein